MDRCIYISLADVRCEKPAGKRKYCWRHNSVLEKRPVSRKSIDFFGHDFILELVLEFLSPLSQTTGQVQKIATSCLDFNSLYRVNKNFQTYFQDQNVWSRFLGFSYQDSIHLASILNSKVKKRHKVYLTCKYNISKNDPVIASIENSILDRLETAYYSIRLHGSINNLRLLRREKDNSRREKEKIFEKLVKKQDVKFSDFSIDEEKKGFLKARRELYASWRKYDILNVFLKRDLPDWKVKAVAEFILYDEGNSNWIRRILGI